MNDQQIYALEKLISRKGPSRRWLVEAFRRARGKTGFEPRVEADIPFNIMCVGGWMEDAGELLKLANDEIEKSKQHLRDTQQQISKMVDVTIPALTEQINHIRSLRMTITHETHATVQALKEVSGFFLEHDYEAEMQRLQRFVGLCEQLKALKADGTLDALSDTIIRLAYKEASR